ncbi:hypothetical protein AQUCO_03800007v1 [Aquilegia coerulea]|uniref:RING-type E3 ubiquitin transferase n=1 Tax=Aquilegia coerulea TaxID=218851 RepID=A0A2G5CS73_AQUCA|nr:hypothetical protein AQUCO_03800007v1 [Aquilegia coerulea]
MEISLLNTISQLNHLASCNNIKAEPVQKYYQKIDEILKLLRPIRISSNEEVIKIFKELDGVVNVTDVSLFDHHNQRPHNQHKTDSNPFPSGIVNQPPHYLECSVRSISQLPNVSHQDYACTYLQCQLHAQCRVFRELVESWYPTASTFSLITRIQASCLDGLQQLLSSLHQYHLPDHDLNPISVENSVHKLQCIGYDEQTSTVIKEPVRTEAENSTPASSEIMVKFQAEQDENDTEAKCIDHMICLVTVMHDLLVKIKQSQRITKVPIPPADLSCPLSLELMMDPVLLASGQTYERIYITRWLNLALTVCPKTRQTLANTNLIPNYTVKALIVNWCETNNVTIHPDPVKSMNINQTAALLSHADSAPSDSPIHPHSAYPSTRTNHVRSNESTSSSTKTNIVTSTESARSTSSSSHKSTHSHGGSNTERKSLSHARSDFDGALNGEVGNGFGLDVGRITLGSSEERADDRSIDSGGQPLVPSKEDNLEASGADDQFHAHSRNASVSSSVSNTEYIQGTPGDVNEVSQGSGDLTHYSSNASGQLSLDSPSRASLHLHRESEFSPTLMETGSRNHTIWHPPTERYIPRIVSASAIDTRADILGIETQVKKLVGDMQSMYVDLQRAATAELRLLSKHNTDNRIVIANCGAIPLLVGLLHSKDIHTQENAVTALFNLSINDNNKTVIANADAIDPLIHVLGTGSVEGKENSAATLCSLSVIEENKVRIARSGAIIGPLVELLGNGTPRGKKDAATALFNLSIFHENKARIVQAGAVVKYLVELMDPAAGMVEKAVAVLANLATIRKGQKAIGVAGGIPVLVEVIELGSARGKEHATAALLQLCTNSNRFCSMALQDGAVPPLVALSQSGTPRAKEKAHALLGYLRNQQRGHAARG